MSDKYYGTKCSTKLGSVLKLCKSLWNHSKIIESVFFWKKVSFQAQLSNLLSQTISVGIKSVFYMTECNHFFGFLWIYSGHAYKRQHLIGTHISVLAEMKQIYCTTDIRDNVYSRQEYPVPLYLHSHVWKTDRFQRINAVLLFKSNHYLNTSATIMSRKSIRSMRVGFCDILNEVNFWMSGQFRYIHVEYCAEYRFVERWSSLWPFSEIRRLSFN